MLKERDVLAGHAVEALEPHINRRFYWLADGPSRLFWRCEG
jgi:hypothetical protein